MAACGEKTWPLMGRNRWPLTLDLLDRPEMITGRADTGWLDRLVASDSHILTRHADVALLAAAIDTYDSEQELERRSFYASASRGRPQASHEIGRTVDLRHRGQAYRLAVAQTPPVVTRSRPTARR